MSDLNERVQARLTELSAVVTDGADTYDMKAQRFARAGTSFRHMMIESWRERWGRHQPRKTKDTDGDPMDYCIACCGEWYFPPWPCVEAKSVLHEIGVEP